jgi:hypothetical protein
MRTAITQTIFKCPIFALLIVRKEEIYQVLRLINQSINQSIDRSIAVNHPSGLFSGDVKRPSSRPLTDLDKM